MIQNTLLGTFLCLCFLAAGDGLRCVQCDSDVDTDCKNSPPSPKNCTTCISADSTGECKTYLQMKYCITEKRYMNSTLTRITRDCSPTLVREKCQDTPKYSKEGYNRVCYDYCKTDGCNAAVLHNACIFYVISTIVCLCVWLLPSILVAGV